jgi:hypothetical protein
MCKTCENCGAKMISQYCVDMAQLRSDEKKAELERLAKDDPEAAGIWSCCCPHIRKCEGDYCGDCI